MNPNMNMHPGVPVSAPNPMMQASPQQMVAAAQQPTPQQQQQQAQQQAEKIDNISKVKSLLGPLRESFFLSFRAGAFALQQNNLADNLKRDAVTNPQIHKSRFDKHLEDFYAYCDQIEMHLKTAIQCMQQFSSAQHYLPGSVTQRVEPTYIQEGPMALPYPAFLNTARAHVQSAKDIHDTLISAAQNISQAD